MKPVIVCLCGSTRFREEFRIVNYQETLAGKIVLAPGVFSHSGDKVSQIEKDLLDELHLRKIDLADEVMVICPGRYIGEGCQREIDYAIKKGKQVTYVVEIQSGKEEK